MVLAARANSRLGRRFYTTETRSGHSDRGQRILRSASGLVRLGGKCLLLTRSRHLDEERSLGRRHDYGLVWQKSFTVFAVVANWSRLILVATLSAVPAIPAIGLVLVLSVDWFVGIARAVGNLTGNCVATVVVAAWENDLDLAKAKKVLDAGVAEETELPA